MVKFENESSLLDAIKDVRSDATEANWVLAAHVDNSPDTIRLAGSGSGGVDELSSGFDDNAVMYGLCKFKFFLMREIKVVGLCSEVLSFLFFSFLFFSFLFFSFLFFSFLFFSFSSSFLFQLELQEIFEVELDVI